MRICIDARYATSDRHFGIRRYSIELVRALAAVDDENEYVVLVNRGNASRIVNHKRFTELEVPGRIDSLRNFVFGARRLRNIRADIYHSLYHVLPFGARGRTVVTLHHHAGFDNGDATEAPSTFNARAIMNYTLRRADHILAVSKYVADHTIPLVGSDPVRITVSPTGIDERYHVAGNDRIAHPDDPPRYLVVGYGDPPRNVSRVVAAMALLRERLPAAVLEIIGEEAGHETLRGIVTTLSLQDRVTITRGLSDDDLLDRMRSATALVYPSLNETCGAPILEAQAAGCPVITGDRGPLAELAGDAAILVDTSDTWEIADAMERVFRDSAKRERLVRDGISHARAFTWAAAAKRTVDAYEHLMHRSPRSILAAIR